jgi:acyl-CoA reductase-like NAD-dependent aldehyde dehydrogenase
MPDVPFAPLLIDGERRPTSTGATYSVYSPHTGALASTAAAASSEDCRAAIEAAQRAFPAWEAMLPAMRKDILLRAAATFQSEEWQKKVAPLMQAEAAMPRSHILFNVVAGVRLLGDVASLANNLKGEMLPSIVPGGQVFVQRRAHGVMYVFVIWDCLCCGAYQGCRYSVVPWNAPIPLTISSVAVPIICGNTVVIRPSEICPYTSYLVVEALHEVRE